MPTFKIISVTRGETKGSKSPMWRCTTESGERANIFQHADPNKDNSRLFVSAGYHEELSQMQLNQEIRWTNSPIVVEMVEDGQWWKITQVAPRPDGSKPDPFFVPDLDLYRRKAVAWAWSLQVAPRVVYWDFETSGTDKLDAEPIGIGILDENGRALLDALIKPNDLGRVDPVKQKHGITPEQLQVCPTFPQLYKDLCQYLSGAIWVGYNIASFDAQILEMACIRHGLIPISNIGINDAMQIFSEFHGEWDWAWQKFKPFKLTEAAEMFGIETPSAHNALADALTTYELVRGIAADGGIGA
jgi:DNA polymerase III epsilon subunit-like protein